VALLAGGAVGYLAITTSRDSLRQEILNANLTQADLTAQFAAEYMTARQTNILVFASNPTLRQAVLNNTPEQAQTLLSQFAQVQAGLTGASIFDANGIQRVFSTVGAATIGQSFMYRDYVQQAITTSQPYLGVPTLSAATGKATAPYGVPILDDQGKVRGVLSGGISLAALSDALVKAGFGKDTDVSIIDTRNGGLIVADMHPERLLTQVSGEDEAVRRLLAGERSAIETVSSSGEKQLAAFASVPDLPWGVLVVTPSSTALAAIDTLTQQAILYTGIITLCAAIIAASLALGISRPIRRLVEGTKEVGLGNLDHKVGTARKDEIGELSRAFDHMVQELKQTLVSRDVLAMEVTEHKQAEEEIKRYNAELRSLNKELETFSYSVSHDLRAPLRSIDGFSQLLLEDYNDKLDDTGKDHLRRVRAASQRMADLIDGLLTLSRTARYEMHQQEVDLAVIARTIIDELKQSSPQRLVEFSADGKLLVSGDKRLLGILLQNLIGNSWKFTGKHPQAMIELGVEERDGRKVYFVRDDGVGFDMAYADKLFAPFQRLHGAAEFAGSGIGLSTAQRIVSRHNGRIWAEGKVG